MPVGHAGDERAQRDPLGSAGDEAERRVPLEHRVVAVRNPSIWKKWSMNVNQDAPPASAAAAVLAMVGAIVSGLPGRVKSRKWNPKRMDP